MPSKGNDLLRAAQAESASPYRTSHKPQEQKSIEIICHQPVAGRIDFFTRSGSDAELHRWDEGSLQRKYPKELERYKTPNPSTIVTGNDKEPGFSVLGSIDEYLERSRRSNDELAPVLRDRMSQTLEQRTKVSIKIFRDRVFLIRCRSNV